jgi:hypothetical protein
MPAGGNSAKPEEADDEVRARGGTGSVRHPCVIGASSRPCTMRPIPRQHEEAFGMRGIMTKVRTRRRAGRKLRLLVGLALMALVSVAGPAVEQASAEPPSEVVWLNRDFRWTLRGPEIDCTDRPDSPFQTETTPARPGGFDAGIVNRTYSCTDRATGNRLSVTATFLVTYEVDHRANAFFQTRTTYQPGGGAPVNCSGPSGVRTYRTNLLRDEVLTGPADYWSQLLYDDGGNGMCDDGTQISTFFSFWEGVRAT